jgi:hypothetical protein
MMRQDKVKVRSLQVPKPAQRRLPDLSAFRASIKRTGRKEITISDLRRAERY